MKKLAFVITITIVLLGCQKRVNNTSPELDKKQGKMIYQGKLLTGIIYENYNYSDRLYSEQEYKKGV